MDVDPQMHAQGRQGSLLTATLLEDTVGNEEVRQNLQCVCSLRGNEKLKKIVQRDEKPHLTGLCAKQHNILMCFTELSLNATEACILFPNLQHLVLLELKRSNTLFIILLQVIHGSKDPEILPDVRDVQGSPLSTTEGEHHC